MGRAWPVAFVACVILGGTLRAAGPDETLARTQALMARGDYRGALAVLEPLDARRRLTVRVVGALVNSCVGELVSR
jgi:hypothetical protein